MVARGERKCGVIFSVWDDENVLVAVVMVAQECT